MLNQVFSDLHLRLNPLIKVLIDLVHLVYCEWVVVLLELSDGLEVSIVRALQRLDCFWDGFQLLRDLISFLLKVLQLLQECFIANALALTLFDEVI